MGVFYDPSAKRLGPLLRGHVLMFDRREGPSYAAWQGLALLAIVLVLELMLGPRMSGLALVGVESPPADIRNGLLVVLALALAFLVAQMRPRDIGIVGKWHADEALYLAQALVIGAVIFVALFGQRLGLIGGGTEARLLAASLIGANLLWGLYQEIIYRGMLQTELSRRFGGIAGALIANLAFTFGPLHFNHLQRAGEDPTGTAIMMAAIFGIGLVFSIIFARTRNVLLVGVLHGIGNVFGNVGIAQG